MTTEQKELPTGWKWVKLGDVCEVNPRRPSALNAAEDKPTTFVPMTCVDNNSRGISRLESRPFTEVAKGYTYFEENDVIYAKITPCMENGKHAIARGLQDGFGFGSTEFHVIRVGNESIPDWIHQYITLPSKLREAKAHFTGTAGQQRVPKEFLHSLPIPLPPLEEQKRIAGILNKAEEIKKLREEADKKTEELIPAIFHEMFGDPARNDKGWEFGTIESYQGQVKYGLSVPPTMVEGGVPIIRATNINQGSISTKALLNTLPEHIPLGKDVLLQKGDVLVVRSGAYTGDIGYISQEWAGSFAGYDLIVNPGKRLIGAFLSWYLLSPYVQNGYFNSLKQRSAQPHLNRRQVLDCPIFCPPIEEQIKFELVLSGIRELQRIQSDSTLNCDLMSSSLLQMAFRGEL